MSQLPRTVRLALICALGSLVGPFASSAQDASSTFSEVIDVRVVNVEVVVEDGKGRRVTGLGPEHFRLLVDGSVVGLEHFAEIRGGRSVPLAPGASSLRPPAAAAAAEARVANSFLIFIDDYFAIGAQRNQVLKQLRRQLDRIEAPDRVAVVAFGGRELELLTPWTSDRGRIAAALEAASRRPAWGLMRFAERERQGISVPPGALGGFFPGGAEYELRREASALASAMRGLAGAPGRKSAIILSGGWPSIDTSIYTRRRFPEEHENDLDLMRPVIETANLLGFTLYLVDVPGFRGSAQIVPRSAGLDTSWRETAGERREEMITNAPTNASPAVFTYGQPWDDHFGVPEFQLPLSDSHRELLRQSTLRVVARDTGGRALLGASRGRALAEVVDDTASYYWLSFTPQRDFDDDRHRIRVEVLGGDYRVRTRRSFRDLSTRAQVSMVTLGAALVSSAATPEELAIEVGEPRRAGFRKVELPLTVEIPLDRVHLLPAADGFAAQLELRLAAVDSADRHTEVPIITVPIALDRRPAAGETMRFGTTVTLRRGARTLVVSLYDPIAGKVLLATSDVGL